MEYGVIDMGRPSKPMAKNSNSKYTPRNNKSDIFSKFSQKSEAKSEARAEAKSEAEVKKESDTAE
jgi:hypothetical protein